MTRPLLLSHTACADAIETLLNPPTYQRFSAEAKRWTKEHFDYAVFRIEFNGALSAITGS